MISVRGFLQEVFGRHFGAYTRAHGVSAEQGRAARQIKTCRTAAQGSHVRLCPNGDYMEHFYNSCKHRSCPRCGGYESQRWADRQQAKALACSYFHIIFTLPDELNTLWHYNRRVFASLFFRAQQEALESLYADPRWVGGRPGALAVFQSWGETLNVHPHLHVIITAGGLAPDGRWVAANRDYLMPLDVLRKRFHGLFLTALRQALYVTKTLVPPDGQSVEQVMGLFNRLAVKRWHVQIQPSYRHLRGVVRYLAFYLRGGPIAESRLDWTEDGRVRLAYKRPGEHRSDHLTLGVDEFIRRILVHVPPSGLHMARAWGLFHPRAAADYEQARSQLADEPAAERPEPAPANPAAAPREQRLCCPHCGSPLTVLRQARSPPMRAAA